MRIKTFMIGILALSVVSITAPIMHGPALAAQASHAVASETTPPPAPTPTTPPSVPEEYIIEAQGVLQRCLGDATMRSFKNCDCMASLFLDKRIAHPDKSNSWIYNELSEECIDGADAAGAVFDGCVNTPPLIEMNRKQEDYCACVARVYLDLFKQMGAPMTSQALVAVESEANKMCSDPALTSTLYPAEKNPPPEPLPAPSRMPAPAR